MIARIVLISALLFGTPLFARNAAATDGRWHFDAKVGLEGQAFAVGKDGFRIEVECGNGGGPSILLVAPPPSFQDWDKRIFLGFEIDGKRFSEAFECHPGGKSCGTFGFPSNTLIAAMRQGMEMVVHHRNGLEAHFSLAGSNAAISRLATCLEPVATSGR